MSTKFEELAEAAWDEAALIHRSKKHKDWVNSFASSDMLPIDDCLKTLLLKADLKGKSIGQLNCNNGRELISLKILGAHTCVGLALFLLGMVSKL